MYCNHPTGKLYGISRLRGYVWMDRNVPKEEFLDSLKSKYIFDGEESRFARIFKTETQRADNGGSRGYVEQNGATWKRRIGRYVYPWPRPSHQADIDIGWIPFDERYPNTDEMFSAESEINCYCHDEYAFTEEMPTD